MERVVSATVLETLCQRVGVMKAGRVGSYILEWAVCSQELKHEPTMEEFIAWCPWRRRTTFRRQAEFREAFPEWSTPQPFADLVQAELSKRRSARSDPAALVVLAKVAIP